MPIRHAGAWASAAVLGVALTMPAAAQSPKPAAAPTTKKASAPATFDTMVASATTAREASKFDEALALYAKLVKMRPSYAEGYFFIGTINHELDRYQPARDAFRRVTDLQPKNGAAWTFKGYCEFQLQRYDVALTDLERARALGFGANKDLANVGGYHLAILLTRNEQFEQALQMLQNFGQEGGDSPRIIEALGMAALRMPMLPSELPGVKRQMVLLAGRASYYASMRLSASAQKAFEELVTLYSDTPNVHYAYGVFLTSERPDEAIEQFKTELKLSTRHPWARMQIASEYIRRGDFESARPWAEQAVTEAPHLYTAHLTLGQVLLEGGDVPEAIREFEEGARLAPQSPTVRFSLARAYRRAGRTADAEREQAEFARLDRLARTERAGAQSVGAIDAEGREGTKPPPQQ